MSAAEDRVREWHEWERGTADLPLTGYQYADAAIAALEAELAETKTELYGATEAVHEFCVCDNDDCNLASAEGCSGHWAITVTCADRWSYAELKQIRAETAEAELAEAKAMLDEFRRVVDKECRSQYEDWGGNATNRAIDVVLGVFDDLRARTAAPAPTESQVRRVAEQSEGEGE